MDHVLEHYESIGFRQEDSTIHAANNIVSFITNKFDSQVSLFQTIEPDEIIKLPSRKRSYRDRPKGPSKRAKKSRQFDSARPPSNQPSSQETEEILDESIGVTASNGAKSADPTNSHCSCDGANPESLRPIAANAEACIPPPHVCESTVTAEDTIGHGISRIPITSTAPLSNICMNGSQTQPLALGANSLNNAAHIMNEFHLEPITYDTNAAQLLNGFDLEAFGPTDYTNAAQLMQQFDMYNRYYSQQPL